MKQHLELERMEPDSILPTRATAGAAGFDLHSMANITLRPGRRLCVPTGIRCTIPQGWVGLIYPRSGWAVKHGLDKLAGVIDSDYRGEIQAVLINSGNEPIQIVKGDRVAQMVVVPFLSAAVEVDFVGSTDRGASGFGSTGN